MLDAYAKAGKAEEAQKLVEDMNAFRLMPDAPRFGKKRFAHWKMMPKDSRINMSVSENRVFSPQIIHGLVGFSIVNHPFWGTPIFGNIQIYLTLKS